MQVSSDMPFAQLDFLASHFLHPAYVLPGLALISIPIIIHFINRMRFRRVKFAAMEFLLASQKRNRRRLLLEQLLLLLLRVLVVMAVVFLISRPILNAAQMAFFQGQKTHHVVLLDDSASQQEIQGDKSAFQHGIEVLTRIVGEGARQPGTQTLTLLQLSNLDKPVFVQQTMDPKFQQEFERRAKTLTCSHRALDLPTGIQSAARLLQSLRGSTKHFHLITDFRTQDWTDVQPVTVALKEVEKAGAGVNLIRSTIGGTPNIGIIDLTGNVDVAAANVPLRLKVTVMNFSDQVRQNVTLEVTADKEKLPVSVPFEKLEPGREQSREFDVVFANAGSHEVRVNLPLDAYDPDNHRYLAVRIPEVNPVLVIDGGGGSDAQFLADALAPIKGLTGFEPSIQNVEFLRRSPLDGFQAIYLVNVAQLHPFAQRALENYVESGGGLCWYVGPQVNASFYSETLYRPGFGIGPEEPTLDATFRKRDTNADGKLTKTEFLGTIVADEKAKLDVSFQRLDKDADATLTLKEFSAPRNGLFPAKLGTVTELPVDDVNLAGDVDFSNHSLFTVFNAGDDNPYEKIFKISQYFGVAKGWKPDEGVRIIATVRNKAPLFLEHRYGKGTVITCLTSCGINWTNWPRNPSYVVMQLELEKYIARSEHALDRRIVGEPIRSRLDAAVFKNEVTITLPDGNRETRFAVPETVGGTPAAEAPATDAKAPATAAPASKPATQALTVYVDQFTNTDLPGVYGLIRQPLSGGTDIERFAYNVPASESRLQLIPTDRLKKNLGSDVAVEVQEFNTFNWITGKGQEFDLARYVLWFLLFILVCEQLMAFRLSFHPKQRVLKAA